ncbi:hypothetical protein ACRZ5S_22530 (plasmid) [Vibrio scophthalmi]|uniref:hypothetical protein n=1 Tax=Vibrio scophthalmi TaxID=45658 RepID=UPI003EBB3635
MTLAPTHHALSSLRFALIEGMKASKDVLYENMQINQMPIDPDPQMALRTLKVRVEAAELTNTGYQYKDIAAHYHDGSSHIYYRYYTHISRLVEEMEHTLNQYH